MSNFTNELREQAEHHEKISNDWTAALLRKAADHIEELESASKGRVAGMKCTQHLRCGPPYECQREAKWLVLAHPRCTKHALASNKLVMKYGRVPIKEGAAQATTE